MDLQRRGVREVVELHALFQAWFAASGDAAESSEGAFDRFASVLDPTFEMVTPDGAVRRRDDILDLVRDAHGSSRADQTFRIWIDRPASRLAAGDIAIVTYEEWQCREGATRGRASTAVFRECTSTPNGVVWLHVHETWLG